MRALFVSHNRCRSLVPVTPLGLASLAACLRARGHEALVLDQNFAVDTDEEMEKAVRSIDPDLIALSIRNFFFGKTRKSELDLLDETIAVARRTAPRAVLLLGGPGFSFAPGRCLARAGLSHGILGDGERPLLAVLDRLAAGRPFDDVPGVVTAGREGEARPWPLEDLDAFPLTDSISYDKGYVGWAVAPTPYPELKVHGLQSQRGCPFRCRNCSVPSFAGVSPRYKSPRLLREEAEALARTSHVNRFFLADDLVTLSPDHLMDRCDALRGASPRMQWSCITCNAIAGLDRDLFRSMRDAGCEGMVLDTCTASDAMLESLGKAFSGEDVERVTRHAREEGISTFHHLSLGFPGETFETASEALERMDRLGARHVPVIFGVAIYPGTALDEGTRDCPGRIASGSPYAPDLYLSPALAPGVVEKLVRSYRPRHPDWFFASVVPGIQQWVNS